jgi:trehalose 6-phosphate phosphatase
VVGEDVERWLECVGSPDRLVCATDFDGTLSEIVSRPDLARAPEQVPALLRRLAERLRRVLVVSGRPVAFLADRLGLSEGDAQESLSAYGGAALDPDAGGLWLVGLYGAEWQREGEAPVRLDLGPEATERLQVALERLSAAVGEAGPDARDAELEPKPFSVTLHWRRVRDEAVAAFLRQEAQRVADELGLMVGEGKRAAELHLPGLPHKGDALERFSTGAAGICYLGDDLGDVPAFASLHRLGAERHLATLAVAVGEDAPDELLAEADLVLASPAEVISMLESLAAWADGSGASD